MERQVSSSRMCCAGSGSSSRYCIDAELPCRPSYYRSVDSEPFYRPVSRGLHKDTGHEHFWMCCGGFVHSRQIMKEAAVTASKLEPTWSEVVGWNK